MHWLRIYEACRQDRCTLLSRMSDKPEQLFTSLEPSVVGLGLVRVEIDANAFSHRLAYWRDGQMKEIQRTCQTYRQTLPTQPAEARHCAGLRSSPRSQNCARRHHSWARGIGSSARLESVAHVENTVMDVYYRNDSMKSVGKELLEGYCIECVDRFGYSQSRVKRGKQRCEERRELIPDFCAKLYA
jgi:hypothetical protein